MIIQKEKAFLYKSVEQVELSFYQAFGTGDFVLMESLFADHGVSCTHPNTRTITGRKNVIDNWKFILEGIPKTIIDIEVLNVSKSKEVEVHQLIESFEISGKPGQMSEIFTTNVYVLQESGWKIQMQHASLAKITTPVPKRIIQEHIFAIPIANEISYQ